LIGFEETPLICDGEENGTLAELRPWELLLTSGSAFLIYEKKMLTKMEMYQLQGAKKYLLTDHAAFDLFLL
jgi:hypothetical protein